MSEGILVIFELSEQLLHVSFHALCYLFAQLSFMTGCKGLEICGMLLVRVEISSDSRIVRVHFVNVLLDERCLGPVNVRADLYQAFKFVNQIYEIAIMMSVLLFNSTLGQNIVLRSCIHRRKNALEASLFIVHSDTINAKFVTHGRVCTLFLVLYLL